MSETALFAYKCTAYYQPGAEIGFRWDDPEVRIAWPVTEPVLSEKDGRLPMVRDIPEECLSKVAEKHSIASTVIAVAMKGYPPITRKRR